MPDSNHALKPRFDNVITTANVIQIVGLLVGFILGGGAIYNRLDNVSDDVVVLQGDIAAVRVQLSLDMRRLEDKIKDTETFLEPRLRSAETSLAVHAQRLNELEKLK